MRITLKLTLTFCLLSLAVACRAEFVDQFEGSEIDEGWITQTGDGKARLSVEARDGHASMVIDARPDRHNVWWTIIKRNIAEHLDLEKLSKPEYELRVEARVRPSHAPRRVNFMINTQRTVDYHKQLREYELTEAGEWHTISMTTRELDIRPDDELNVQLSVTDWGIGEFRLDVDYYRARIVAVDEAGPDEGEPLVYHPPVPELESFDQSLLPAGDVLLNANYPKVNFHGWQTPEDDGVVPVLTVSARQWPLMRWDFSDWEDAEAEGVGVLELTTHSIQRGGHYRRAYGDDLGVEFGKVRVFEVYGGPKTWKEDELTYADFVNVPVKGERINGQMAVDKAPAVERGGKTHIVLPRPVMQRLLDGRTRGLILRPLGALEVSFYDADHEDKSVAPKLYFNLRPDSR